MYTAYVIWGLGPAFSPQILGGGNLACIWAKVRRSSSEAKFRCSVWISR